MRIWPLMQASRRACLLILHVDMRLARLDQVPAYSHPSHLTCKSELNVAILVLLVRIHSWLRWVLALVELLHHFRFPVCAAARQICSWPGTFHQSCTPPMALLDL